MNLNDSAAFPQIDPNGMLAHIDGLPDQLQAAWELDASIRCPPGRISSVCWWQGWAAQPSALTF